MSEKFQEYVLVSARHPYTPHKVLVIHKDTPAWQKGRINLPGGKIEEGELPPAAAKRELLEETGLECIDDPVEAGKITFDTGVVYILRAIVGEYFSLEPEPGKNEYPEWIDWVELLKDKRLLPNLKLIIPLCQACTSPWEIKSTTFGDNNACTMEIVV